VAVPISWDEIEDIDPNGIALSGVPDRPSSDPWAGHVTTNFDALAPEVDDALEEAGVVLEPFDRFRS
jgi:DNA primase